MSDTLAAASPDIHTRVADEELMFYVVSARKLMVLYLVTFGAYGVYWFYKNWDRYNKNWPGAAKAGKGIWPVPRALLPLFFTHRLFARIKDHGSIDPRVKAWPSGWQATVLLVLSMVSTKLNIAVGRSEEMSIANIFSLAILIPLAFQFLQVQEMINIGCNDRLGVTNDRLTGANYAWIAAGSLLWCFTIRGLLLS
jgi:hypothetical protein